MVLYKGDLRIQNQDSTLHTARQIENRVKSLSPNPPICEHRSVPLVVAKHPVATVTLRQPSGIGYRVVLYLSAQFGWNAEPWAQ